MALQDGSTEGSFDSSVPRLQDMVGGKRGGIDQMGGPAMPFCGVFQPKLIDFTEELSSGFSSKSLFIPVNWRLS